MWPFLCFLFMSSDEWRLQETEIYHRLSVAQVALTEKDELYVLDRAGCGILHYNAEGQKLNRFSRKGRGPGELQQPSRIAYMDERLYVFDWRRVHVFTPSGEFIERFDQPDSVNYFDKTTKGWVGLSKIDFRMPDEPHRLLWFSEDRRETRVMGEWSGGLPVKISLTTNYCNPAKDSTLLSLSPDRRFAAVKPINAAKIYIFDLSRLAIHREIAVPGTPPPFNKDWGERYIQKLKRQNVACKPDFPEYFPLVASMGFSISGKVMVYKWSPEPFLSEAEPGIPGELLAYDINGHPAAASFIDKNGDRIVAVDGPWYYVTAVTQDDEHTVEKVHSDKLEKFLENNPYSGTYYFELPPF